MLVNKDLVENVPKFDGSIWQLVMLFLCVYVLSMLVVQTLVDLPEDINDLLTQIDNGVCMLFIADFIGSLIKAERKLAYLKWGWVDLISSIPNVKILRWGRFARVIRILRIMRGLRSSKAIVTFLLKNRAKSAFASTALISFVLVVFGSIAILNAEGPNANIKNAHDAFWWAFVTITTVGYGDYYPTSMMGRLIAGVLITAGVGLFGTFTAYVASFFLEPGMQQELSDDRYTHHQEEILRELQDIKQRLEYLENQYFPKTEIEKGNKTITP